MRDPGEYYHGFFTIILWPIFTVLNLLVQNSYVLYVLFTVGFFAGFATLFIPAAELLNVAFYMYLAGVLIAVTGHAIFLAYRNPLTIQIVSWIWTALFGVMFIAMLSIYIIRLIKSL